jgi:hypothetical protein
MLLLYPIIKEKTVAFGNWDMPRKGTPQAKLRDKPLFLYDTGGLYLELSPSGSKSWRLALLTEERVNI